MSQNRHFSQRMTRSLTGASAAILLALITTHDADAITVQAGILNVESTPTSTQTIDFTNSGGYAVTAAACTSCIAVTSAFPGISGTFGFSLAVSPATQVGPATAVAGDPGLYVESYNALAGGGTLGISGSSSPISATISGFTVFGAPGTGEAQIDLALSSVKVDGFTYTDPAGPLYLDITGTTEAPISFAGGATKDFSSFSLDWAGSIVSSASGAPLPVGYVPPSSAPEINPASAGAALSLLLGGSAVLRGRRRV